MTKIQKLRTDSKKLRSMQNNMKVLKHISRKNCELLPYLNDESLHALGEFLFNVITQRLKLSSKQLKRVKRILNKDKNFYLKLIDVKTKNSLYHLRQGIKDKPQIGSGIITLLSTLAPLIASLFIR
jgi:hypothetical protein